MSELEQLVQELIARIAELEERVSELESFKPVDNGRQGA